MNLAHQLLRLFAAGAFVGFNQPTVAAVPTAPAPTAPAHRATPETAPRVVVYPPVLGKSLVREDAYIVAAAPERVFPLLCPAREYEWLPGWRCDMLRSTSGVAELECVFRTTRADAGTMTWVVTRYEPPHCIEFTCFNATTEHIMRLGIQLDVTPTGGTRLLWRRAWIATGPAGEAVVERFDDDAHAKMMHGLEYLMNYYLEHGAMPPPAPAKP